VTARSSALDELVYHGHMCLAKGCPIRTLLRLGTRRLAVTELTEGAGMSPRHQAQDGLAWPLQPRHLQPRQFRSEVFRRFPPVGAPRAVMDDGRS
jgi:hypothetical protein